jgi:hypothetical protein
MLVYAQEEQKDTIAILRTASKKSWRSDDSDPAG